MVGGIYTLRVLWRRYNARMILGVALLLMLLGSNIRSSESRGKFRQIEVSFNGSKQIYMTSPYSPSVAVGMGLFKYGWIKYLGTTKFLTLVRALGLFYVRMGGTRSDHSYFKASTIAGEPPRRGYFNTARELDCVGRMPNRQEFEQHLVRTENAVAHDKALKARGGYETLNVTYTAAEFDKFMDFILCSGGNLIFGLNQLIRKNDSWDPFNAVELLQYAKSKHYRINWELGNEPNSYRHKEGIYMSPKQVADGFIRLNGILRRDKWWKKSSLSGPDANGMFRPNNRKFLSKFLHYAGTVTNAVTFHQYYINSVNATVDNFTDYKILNNLEGQIQRVIAAIRKENSDSPIWLGETSSSFGGGADGLSNTYVAGFMWLDKLGICAANGIANVFRQTLFESYYALINNNFDPNPDYWLTLLYKTLVGSKVLNVTVASEGRVRNNGKFRVYAHCTSTRRSNYNAGSVTLYYLNLLSHARRMVLGPPIGYRQPSVANLYILTADSGTLTSSYVLLNDKRLEMIDTRTMPVLKPKEINLEMGEQIVLPEKSFGFVVFPDAFASACR